MPVGSHSSLRWSKTTLPGVAPPLRRISITLAPATALTLAAGTVKTRVRFQVMALWLPSGRPFMVTVMSWLPQPGPDQEEPQIRSMLRRSRALAEACAASSMKRIRLWVSFGESEASKLAGSSFAATLPTPG